MSKNCCVIPWLCKHTPRCTYTNKSQWINVEKQPAALHPSAKKKGSNSHRIQGTGIFAYIYHKKSTIHVGEYTRPGYYGIIFIKAPSFPFFKRQVSTGRLRKSRQQVAPLARHVPPQQEESEVQHSWRMMKKPKRNGSPSLVGGFSPTHLKKIYASQIGCIFLKVWGEDKYLKPPPR